MQGSWFEGGGNPGPAAADSDLWGPGARESTSSKDLSRQPRLPSLSPCTGSRLPGLTRQGGKHTLQRPLSHGVCRVFIFKDTPRHTHDTRMPCLP